VVGALQINQIMYSERIMDIKYHKHTKRREKAVDLWVHIANDYNAGMTAIEVARRYNCTRSHVYWVLKKMPSISITI
jgi:DNA invertase Pin-like site-specific DNA recombinase